MALFNAHFFSDVLGMQTEATVILPQPASDLQIGVETVAARKTWPCLWLLHGMSDEHTIWLRRTSIERYAEAAGCAVVMPNCHRSFYCDMKHGGNYWTFLSEELPALMRSFFRFLQSARITPLPVFPWAATVLPVGCSPNLRHLLRGHLFQAL
jgi:putative tributyrin esterase